ncbi:hypothetical protein A3K48_03775 [candidate division WOR-1 bacterium RIFOXYA12_FULL_52_29]|uniref:Uncharacterized protein n=1 Tax=candidate division WOR-1 bacterium RIFOXYC12_FULL_54_18 TaxID=1802584 RepID=A0A1F4T5M7_UNCSA|nr:MAG: hypothetical protein A3K44_03775 [candidate division WOR-1 bacterium RIFOXYA2_FULL_51_19]OGC17678.1 MAG: hypothetical protein A3K48_03775 [candidate division WOR-1 bacterium RIFOXYA12_FULL_52_29]OGC26535.1 MAG: hypothetical protein A3K32_03770 [candidate division WOR-1 bacterium RIFOXYB2_FULL_45_9]OGC28095.1 MAG: hypothetical protein A3K49_03775 [candidate division WOR-1 bacterium RIFOXYC12_FULL_54_18]OGC29619.1 MAG: hypothetical protein A2346_02560 [candidate division WOR-1 bacterium R
MKKLVYSLLLLIPLVIVGCGTTTAGDMTAPTIQGVVVSPEAVAPGGYVKVALRASDSQGNILSYKVGNGASHLYASGAAAVVQASADCGSQDIDIYVGNGRLDAHAKVTVQVDAVATETTLHSGQVTLPVGKSFDFLSGSVRDQYYGDLDYIHQSSYYGESLVFYGDHNGGTTYDFDGGFVNLTALDGQITGLDQVCEKYTGDYYSAGNTKENQWRSYPLVKAGDIYCFALFVAGSRYFGKFKIVELNNSEITFDYVFQTAINETRFYDIGAAPSPGPTSVSPSAESSFSDDAESGAEKWLANGFSISMARAANGTHSFYSGRGNNLNNILTMVSPVMITSGKHLVFQTYYETESSYDYLYVQASLDGATWTSLASYNGSNSSWARKELSLDAYAGRAIFIRFRYATDSSVDYEGVYIDDISIE